MILNPFRILALEVSALKDLQLEQIEEIVKGQFLRLQKIHHPDKGGNEKISRQLNWAREELSDQGRLKIWLEKSLKENRLSTQRTRAEQAVKLVFRQQKLVFNLYQTMFESIINGGQYIDLLGIGKNTIKIWRNTPLRSRDAFMAGIGEKAENEEEKRKIRKKARDTIDQNSFIKLSIENGRLMASQGTSKKELQNRLLIGVITAKTISRHFDGSHEGIERFLKKVCPVSTRLRLTSANDSIDSNQETLQLSRERFLLLLPWLEFELTPESWIFSMSKENGIISFQPEGKILTSINRD